MKKIDKVLSEQQEKVYSFLINWDKEYRDGAQLEAMPTLKDIAMQVFDYREDDRIGTGISLVAYHLNEMRRKGWVELTRGHRGIKLKKK